MEARRDRGRDRKPVARMAFGSVLIGAVVLGASLCAPTTEAAPGRYPPLADGLSFDFYETSCPQVELIVGDFLRQAVRADVGLAAALLRLHFHDCFVQGCDGSILLDGSATVPGEKQAPPNLTLRPAAFKAINDLRDRLEEACGLVVSCADIVALAARDSVFLSGGPKYEVPLGRRDSRSFASEAVVLAALPPPSSNVSELLRFLAKISLDADDLVALSGGHTVGIAHCTSFDARLFPRQDPVMDKWFAGHLRLTCPVKNTDNTTVNDIRTPDVFDNKYYVDLLNRQGLFTSDQDLYTDARTKPLVRSFALDQAAFFDQFVFSMVKMGQIGAGSPGEVRRNCSAPNAAAELPWPLLQAAAEVL